MVAESIKTVLFDLDGTLVDTAPDLAEALNKVLQANGLAPLSIEKIRPQVSNGSNALIRLGFGIEPIDDSFEGLRVSLLDHYQNNLANHSCLFPGMENVLRNIESSGINWGVVTNKPKRFTDPLMLQLGLTARAAIIVSGDSLEYRKPHPEPLLHACRATDCQPQQCVYVGDAQRDIQAGSRAGTRTLLALFGYIEDPHAALAWGADHAVSSPEEILKWLATQQNDSNTA